MLRKTRLSCLLIALAPACGMEGGLNDNGHAPGNEGGGVELSAGDIAVHPSGAYFVAYDGDGTVKGDPATGECIALPGLQWPGRVAFGASLAFVTDYTDDGAEIVGYDVAAKARKWSAPVEAEIDIEDLGPRSYPLVVVDDALAMLGVAEANAVRLYGQADGAVVSETHFDQQVLDLAALPGGMLVTTEESWYFDDELEENLPSTTLVLLDGQGELTRIDVPNCAATPAISKDGRRAFMAPTSCVDPSSNEGKDPVSVIDLAAGSFERNLPGFGPAGATADGARIIAFMDADDLDESLFEDGDPRPEGGDRYHLMLIDPTDLSYELIAIGDELPRYAPSPDGNVLLLDTDDWLADPRVRVVDVAQRTVSDVQGPQVELDDFAFTRDASRAFLIDDIDGEGAALYDLSVAMRKVIEVALDFTPSNLVVTPDDKWLLLRADEDEGLWAFDIAKDRIARPLCTGASR
jgi:hypothetical protein